MTAEDVIKALGWALHHRLEAKFDVELKEWARRSGIEMMGTESIEAGFLADIVRETMNDPRVIQEVIRNLAEIATTPVRHGGRYDPDPR